MGLNTDFPMLGNMGSGVMMFGPTSVLGINPILLISPASSNFEDGTTGNWANFGGATLANSTTVSRLGTHSLQITATAAGSQSACNTNFPVLPDTLYTFSAWFYSPVVSRTVWCYNQWKDVSVNPISYSNLNGNQASPSIVGTWVQIFYSAVSPPNAYNTSVWLSVAGASVGDIVYADLISYNQGIINPASWTVTA